MNDIAETLVSLPNAEFYATLARINAALAAQAAEREEWVKAYDDARARRTRA